MSKPATEKWVLDPNHSEIGFKIRHLMITNIKGYFKTFHANVETKGDDFMTASIDCDLKASSVDTGSPDRDKHVRGPEFFDVENYPVINFKAEAYENVDNDGSYELIGDLTIKGITKKVKLDVEFGGIVKDPWGNEKAGFKINGDVNRKDWGLNWNAALDTGGMMLSDEVHIACEVQLMRSA